MAFDFRFELTLEYIQKTVVKENLKYFFEEIQSNKAPTVTQNKAVKNDKYIFLSLQSKLRWNKVSLLLFHGSKSKTSRNDAFLVAV